MSPPPALVPPLLRSLSNDEVPPPPLDATGHRARLAVAADLPMLARRVGLALPAYADGRMGTAATLRPLISAGSAAGQTLFINGQGSTAEQAEHTTDAVARSYIRYVTSVSNPPPADLLQRAAPAWAKPRVTRVLQAAGGAAVLQVHVDGRQADDVDARVLAGGDRLIDEFVGLQRQGSDVAAEDAPLEILRRGLARDLQQRTRARVGGFVDVQVEVQPALGGQPYANLKEGTQPYENLLIMARRGAKIARRKGSSLVEQLTMTEPIQGGVAAVVHPTQLGGTRHLSAAQFVHDQRDAMALVASQDGRFTVFAWSPCEQMVHAHRVDTLLL